MFSALVETFLKKRKIFFNSRSLSLKILLHQTRLMIVNELGSGRKGVNDIKKLVRINQPNISQHLSLLKLNGIVGNMKGYFLKDADLMREIFGGLKRNKLI